jgi:predicted secreted protein
MTTQGGYGLVIKIEITATLTAIAHVLEADFPEFEKLIAEVTAHDSPSGYAEYISTGKRQMNEFTMTLLWDADVATHAAIVAAFNADPTVNMSIQDPDGIEVIAFAAHVVKIGRQAEQEEGYQAEVTIQPTGVPTIT